MMKGAKKDFSSPAISKAVVFAIAVLLAGAIYGYLNFARGLFPLKQIVITGNRNLQTAEVESLLGVKLGQDMAGLAKGRLADRLKGSAWVERLSLRNEFYSGRILVRLKEREPFALIKKGGRIWIADSKGKLLEQVGEGVEPLLPVIEADPEAYPETFREAMIFARLLKEAGSFDKPLTIFANTDPDGLAMDIDGVAIKVGFGEYERKLEKLRELKAEISRRQIRADSIDLRFANRVIVSPVREVKR